jgi:hypothetical protein
MQAIRVMFDSPHRHLLPRGGCHWLDVPHLTRATTRGACACRARPVPCGIPGTCGLRLQPESTTAPGLRLGFVASLRQGSGGRSKDD